MNGISRSSSWAKRQCFLGSHLSPGLSHIRTVAVFTGVPNFIFIHGGHFLPEGILALSSLVHYTVSAQDVSFRQNLSFHPYITLQLMIVSFLDLCLQYALTPAPLIFSPLFLLRISIFASFCTPWIWKLLRLSIISHFAGLTSVPRSST